MCGEKRRSEINGKKIGKRWMLRRISNARGKVDGGGGRGGGWWSGVEVLFENWGGNRVG